jgi:hypothetical protein
MAGDLKTFFSNPVIETVDPGGETVVSRGGDPLIDTGGESGLKALWDSPTVSTPEGKESPNSESGLPTTPSRVVPAPEKPPMPPTLQDRSPGTIDER